MRTTLAATAAILSTLQLVTGQTFTSCDPTKKDCPPEPALGGTLFTDFTKGASDDWEVAEGTTLTYDSVNGAAFTIAKVGQAPTIAMHKYIMFGKMEVVMRASTGRGVVSSLVLQSADLDEIDWEWIGSDTSNVQTNFFGKGNTATYDRGGIHPMSDPTAAFHTYTIDWTKDRMQWLVDGTVVREVPYSDPKALGGENYPQTPMEVKMGSWIGCASQAAADDPKTKWTCEWAGGAIDLSAGPYVMHVKSVKVTDYGCAESYVYGDRSGSYQSIKSIGSCAGGKGGSNSDDDKPSASASATASSKPSTTPASKTTTGASSRSSAPGILIETSAVFGTSSTVSGTASSTPTLTTATRAQTPAAQTTPAQVTANAGSGISPNVYNAAVIAASLALGYLFI